jgi:fructose-1-phosphate kinase PfkB-like protein
MEDHPQVLSLGGHEGVYPGRQADALRRGVAGDAASDVGIGDAMAVGMASALARGPGHSLAKANNTSGDVSRGWPTD